MERYELTLGYTTYSLKSLNEADARKEAENIVAKEKNPIRQKYWSSGQFGVTAKLSIITDIETYQIYTPTA